MGSTRFGKKIHSTTAANDKCVQAQCEAKTTHWCWRDADLSGHQLLLRLCGHTLHDAADHLCVRERRGQICGTAEKEGAELVLNG